MYVILYNNVRYTVQRMYIVSVYTQQFRVITTHVQVVYV